MEECGRQATEEAERREFVFGQREQKINDDWTAQLHDKEVSTVHCTLSLSVCLSVAYFICCLYLAQLVHAIHNEKSPPSPSATLLVLYHETDKRRDRLMFGRRAQDRIDLPDRIARFFPRAWVRRISPHHTPPRHAANTNTPISTPT